MAVTIDSNIINGTANIDAGIEALIAAATITTFHNTIVEKVVADKFYVAIVYE